LAGGLGLRAEGEESMMNRTPEMLKEQTKMLAQSMADMDYQFVGPTTTWGAEHNEHLGHFLQDDSTPELMQLAKDTYIEAMQNPLKVG
jgi:hypothetical protein